MPLLFSVTPAFAQSTPPPGASQPTTPVPVPSTPPRPKASQLAPTKRAAPRTAPPASRRAAAPPVTNTPPPPQPTLRGGTIEKIVIKGNKKIESDAIRARLVSKEGATYSDEQVHQDIVDLFGLGYFYNIEADRSDGPGITLTFTVTEKPSIAEIVFDGNDEIEDSELKETAAIKPYEILNYGKIREAIEKMEKLYEDKGYFLARVNYKLVPTGEGDNVKLVFDIKENDKVRVKKISFIGNKKLLATKLQDVMFTKEGGFFSFISGSGAYKQEAFDRDVQMLNILYFNEGYVQAKVDRPQVYVTPDKKAIYITIRLEEGEQFKVGTVDFTGDLLFSRSELFETTKIQDQDIFRYQVLQEDLRALQAKYGDLGYAYANPIPRTRIREADREVDITFEIDKGHKVYLGDINVIGNSKTRDKVVRRELRVVEGELYNETRRRESLENVKRLGYFEEVNFNTKAPKGRPEIMDIDIVVKERNTGTIQVGAGYSNFNGFVFNGTVSQINFLGKGQKLNVSIDLSKRQSLYKAGFTEPYFMDTEWLLGGEVYRSQRLLTEYDETKTGGDVRIGHPLAPYLDGSIRYRLDKTELRVDEVSGDPDLFPVNTANGTTSSITFGLEYDKRDDRFAPSKGVFTSVSLEYAGIGGNKNYTRGFGTLRYYRKVFWDVVWRNNLTYGFISSNKPGEEVPFNELFLLGGANSLRGFDWFTIGRRKKSTKTYDSLRGGGMAPAEAELRAMRPYGGTQQLFYNLEFQFPLINEAGIKGVVFYDIGQAEDSIKPEDFRQDVGFGFRWFSPIGPLRFEWGFPLQRRPEYDEDAMNFEFAIGAPF
ncbi:MAG: outer membrane protein assembly factor BamA [Bdellovibrionales bacterium]|nr:outer membrane protein assembly factor BamA [Bdellovibrionales bacterium]